MSAKSKRGGRVTPKGTKNPKKTRVEDGDAPAASESFTDSLPTKMQREGGRTPRPISHNRGNR